MADKQRIVHIKSHPIGKGRDRAEEQRRKLIQKSKERIERSLQQPIYLLEAHRYKEEWKFVILGTTGDEYDVYFNDEMTCSCPDFQSRQLPCKHIYLIFTKLAKDKFLLTEFASHLTSLPKRIYEQLDKKLQKELKDYLSEDIVNEDDNQEDEEDRCFVCFLKFRNRQHITGCPKCKLKSHTVCLEGWRKVNPQKICSVCREKYVVKLTVFSKIRTIDI